MQKKKEILAEIWTLGKVNNKLMKSFSSQILMYLINRFKYQ